MSIISRPKDSGYDIIDTPDGWELKYFNGKLHSDSGPAAINIKTGEQKFFQEGLLHRENGPAIEKSNGRHEWWIKGENLTEEKFNLSRLMYRVESVQKTYPNKKITVSTTDNRNYDIKVAKESEPYSASKKIKF